MNDIEKMTEIIEENHPLMFGALFAGWSGHIAQALTNAGYRKQSDTAREFADKVIQKLNELNELPFIGKTKKQEYQRNGMKSGHIDAIEIINEIAEQYKEEL